MNCYDKLLADCDPWEIPIKVPLHLPRTRSKEDDFRQALWALTPAARDLVENYIKTPSGRDKLLVSCIEPARLKLDYVESFSPPDNRPPAYPNELEISRRACLNFADLMEGILRRCDGRESFGGSVRDTYLDLLKMLRIEGDTPVI